MEHIFVGFEGLERKLYESAIKTAIKGFGGMVGLGPIVVLSRSANIAWGFRIYHNEITLDSFYPKPDPNTYNLDLELVPDNEYVNAVAPREFMEFIAKIRYIEVQEAIESSQSGLMHTVDINDHAFHKIVFLDGKYQVPSFYPVVVD
jgi:hypothetical protein